ncbi:hypothetical protein [Bradyrhizobium symbiodeficiens]|uniref:hypothetical protein n=1 Tax=Bradyrhizobium symbiodeficiens TaxID=1404367 RepID=UPI0011E4CEE5|nr:hypothetical protein [Bradyrhizobium symbiodeficiens]
MMSKIAVAVVASVLLFPDLGAAEEGLLRTGSWPIRDGRNYQPTERELRAMDRQDVTPDQAREIDRLYDELMSNSARTRKRSRTPKY